MYAHIVGGVVFELFTPPAGVAIEDCFQPQIAARFIAVPSGVTPAQGWTYDGSTFAAPVAVPPSLADQARAMLAAGIQIVSTATPALSGTYSCSADTNNEDGNTLAAINAGLTFPGGAIVRLDVAGASHAFPTADFLRLCQAKITFQQTLSTIIGSNSGTLPTLPVTIA